MIEEFNKLAEAIVKGEIESSKAISETIGEKKLPLGTAILEGALKGILKTMELMAAGEIDMMKMADCVKTAYAALEILDKYIVAPKPPAGKVVIGCVKGEAHAVGKDMVAAFLKASGFEVYNIGNKIPPERFIEKIKETSADILGLSASGDTTLPNIKATIEALKAAGIREKVKVLVGGGIVTDTVAREAGADAYGKDPAEAAELAKKWIVK
jgi:5-methyltetrahydrofolate--homocysteine methyltransferase